MNIDKDIQELSEKIKIFDKIFEKIRIIDPLRKKVTNLKDNTFTEEDIECYGVWGKNKICENCISIRAYNDNKNYVKVEYNQEKTYMITAAPIEFNNRKLVFELLQDATSSMLVENGSAKIHSEIYSLIDKLNIAVVKDELTNLYNRRFINERLPVNMLTATMKNQELTLIICDLDHFKSINDQVGHISGDQVLKQFAEIMEGCIRKNDDWVARYGGEEFLVCLPNTNCESATRIAERMRTTLQECQFNFAEKALRVTASFGVCSLTEIGNMSLDTFIACADKKMYLAKETGRNKVCS